VACCGSSSGLCRRRRCDGKDRHHPRSQRRSSRVAGISGRRHGRPIRRRPGRPPCRHRPGSIPKPPQLNIPAVVLAIAFLVCHSRRESAFAVAVARSFPNPAPTPTLVILNAVKDPCIGSPPTQHEIGCPRSLALGDLGVHRATLFSGPPPLWVRPPFAFFAKGWGIAKRPLSSTPTQPLTRKPASQRSPSPPSPSSIPPQSLPESHSTSP